MMRLALRHVLVGLLAAGLPAVQVPRIGIIEFYGLRSVTEKEMRASLGVSEGDVLPASKADVEERLEQARGVVRARLEAVCCEDGKAILYVGIEEKGAPHFSYRYPPESDASLPEEIVATYQRFLAAFEEAARQGRVAAADPDARAWEARLGELTEAHLAKIREVLRHSADETHRAIAAYLLALAPNKSRVTGDLQHALQDPNDAVRYNAVRSLVVIAELARKEEEPEIKISPTWFIEMLNSLLWNDRIKAAEALVTLTESRDPDILSQLRERALHSVVEMARWKVLRHALPAFILAGRLSGLSEEAIQEAWSKGEREAVIARAVKAQVK